MSHPTTRLQVLETVAGPGVGPLVEARPGYLNSAGGFMGHYLRRRPVQFCALFAVVLTAATCGVGVQYGMKLLIDAMTAPVGHRMAVQGALIVFIGLVAIESALWRTSGWLGSQTTIKAGVDIKLDLFDHLAGHAMRYFQERLSGALGHRVSATAGGGGGAGDTPRRGV